MKITWKNIPNYPNYLINNVGDVYSKKTDSLLKGWLNGSGVKYVCLSHKGDSRHFELARLVLDVFQPSQTKIKLYAWHKDLELQNVMNDNLDRCNRSDRQRMFMEMKNKKRGVYKYDNYVSKKTGKNVVRYRVTFKDKNKKTKTFGYYKTEFFARFKYCQFYKKEFGRLPYTEV